MSETIGIIDNNDDRRQETYRQLSRIWHAEPFSSPGELAEFYPRNLKLAFVADCDNLLIETTMQLASIGESPAIVAYAIRPQIAHIVEVIQSGVIDYLAIPVNTDSLEQRLEASYTRMETEIRARQKKVRAERMLAALSDRERDVIQGVVAGGTNKVIARELGISPRTVEIHRANMMRKLEANTAADAARVAFEAGLIN